MTNFLDQVTIENAIDRDGLAAVLEQIATICTEKADHIRVNWQDAPSAKAWGIMCNQLYSLSDRARKYQI